MGEIPSEESIAVIKRRYELVKKPILGYKEVDEGLMKNKEGKYSEAMRYFEKGGELGNKAAFLNMGNCYMFGKGVGQNRTKGVEMWKKCGKIEESEVRWMRKLSNDRFVCGKELDLSCLFKS